MSENPISIYADFNNADTAGRLRLNTAGSLRDLERLPAVQVNGQVVTVVSEDLRVEGIMRFSIEEEIWVAEIDWNAVVEIQ